MSKIEILIAIAAAGVIAFAFYWLQRQRLLARQRAERKQRYLEQEEAWEQMLRDLK